VKKVPVAHFVDEAVLFGPNSCPPRVCLQNANGFHEQPWSYLASASLALSPKARHSLFPHHYCFLSTPQGPKETACGLLLSFSGIRRSNDGEINGSVNSLQFAVI